MFQVLQDKMALMDHKGQPEQMALMDLTELMVTTAFPL